MFRLSDRSAIASERYSFVCTVFELTCLPLLIAIVVAWVKPDTKFSERYPLADDPWNAANDKLSLSEIHASFASSAKHFQNQNKTHEIEITRRRS